MEVIIITGLSGAGKSQAVNCMEDLGYYCIDNMPPRLIREFLALAESVRELTSEQWEEFKTEIRTVRTENKEFESAAETTAILTQMKTSKIKKKILPLCMNSPYYNIILYK